MKKIMLAILIAFCCITTAKAAVLTFDDLPSSIISLPDGYGGFSWNNTSLSLATVAVVSGSQCVSGWQGGDWPNYWWSISSTSGFDFLGAYFTGVYPGVGDYITVNAYNGGVKVRTDHYAINLSPTWVDTNLSNVDKVEIISFDGFPIYMDDFTYQASPIPNPEPSTVVLVVFGLAGMVFLRKKTRA